MAPKLKIALLQIQPKLLSPEANFAKAASEIRSAAQQGCHLAVLPEYYLTGWAPDHPEFVTSCTESVPYLSRYQDLARELNIHIVPGTIVEPVEVEQATTSVTSGASKTEASKPDKELRNLAYFIAASTGDILSVYQKKNLWTEERGILTADRPTPHTAFDVPLPDGSSSIRVGMLICWDLAFPEAFHELVADGAELIVIASYWEISNIDPKVLALNPNSEGVFIDSTTVARAYENTCAVAICNAWGPSQVAMPILGSLGRIGVDEEGTSVTEVDFEVLRLAEEYYKVRADRQGEEWHYSRPVTRPAK